MTNRTTSIFISFLLFGAAGCGAPQREMTCPTSFVSCPCAELERAEAGEEISELVSSLRDLSDARLQIPARAAAGLEARCRERNGTLPPPNDERDAEWRESCSAAEAAIPALLGTLEAVAARREGRSSTSEENSLAARAVSALGNIAIGNAESPCRTDVVTALVAVLGTREPGQDMSVNDQALRMLGALGDSEAAEAMVLALFMRGQRRSLALRESARVNLMQLSDHEAVASSLVRAGRLELEDLDALREADDELDILVIKEQVALTLGMLGVTSSEVVAYLMAELEHRGVDDVDRAAAGERASTTSAQAAAWRRAHAARALGRLRHLPALDTILGRLSLDTDAGRLADSNVDILEVPSYLESLGAFLLSDRTNSVFAEWVVYGRDVNRDRAARWLSYQGNFDHAQHIALVAAEMRECPAAQTRCIRRNLEEGYAPVLRSTAGCTTLECWRARLTASDTTAEVRERAAYQAAMLSHGSRDTWNDTREALLTALLAGGDDAPLEAYVFAIDRLSPEGCEAGSLERLTAHVNEQRERADTGEMRLITGLLGRLRYRSR